MTLNPGEEKEKIKKYLPLPKRILRFSANIGLLDGTQLTCIEHILCQALSYELWLKYKNGKALVTEVDVQELTTGVHDNGICESGHFKDARVGVPLFP